MTSASKYNSFKSALLSPISLGIYFGGAFTVMFGSHYCSVKHQNKSVFGLRTIMESLIRGLLWPVALAYYVPKCITANVATNNEATKTIEPSAPESDNDGYEPVE